ncbi:MAG: TatD family hydrolase [bacterium]
MKYFDAHTHVQFVAYDEDREAVFARAREAGVGMNLVGTQQDTSEAAVREAENHENVWASIALHPVHTSKSYHDTKELGEEGKAFTSRGEVFDFDWYKKLGESKKVIAVGECGLDYYRLEEETKKVQREAFVAQIELANTLQKPLMLHIRNGAHGGEPSATGDAYVDALELLKAHPPIGRAGSNCPGDVHFFAGDWNIAKQFLDIGFTLSFTGVLTFTHDYDEVVRETPLDMLLCETDAPYITPVPFRGQRNEPMHVREVVKKIAEIKGLDLEQVREQILLNSGRVFGV